MTLHRSTNRETRFLRKKEILLFTEGVDDLDRDVFRGVLQYNSIYKKWNVFHLEQNLQKDFPDGLDVWQGDGIISRCRSAAFCEKLVEKNCPVIELTGCGEAYPAQIVMDETAIALMATEHFYQRGFRSLAFFSLEDNEEIRIRRHQFFTALKKYSVSCAMEPDSPRTDRSPSCYRGKRSQAKIEKWLDELVKPVGIFCAHDSHALYLMNLCRRHGLEIPEEVALLGFGNHEVLCQGTVPTLSSIAFDGRQFGFQAAVLLNQVFDGGSLPDRPMVLSPSRLEARESTDFIASQNPVITQAIRFIRDHITQNPSVVELSRHLNLSRATLHRLFVAELGYPPNDEITRYRMNWAKQLLRETNLTVTEISNRLSFQSPSSFVRSFHTLFGVTPMEYRADRAKTDSVSLPN